MGVALRQALRCLPSVFPCNDEKVTLQHCHAALCAFVDLWDREKPNRSRRLTVGHIGLEPTSALNASITVREAARAILRKDSHSASVNREVELCLADSFDVLRDLFEESTKIHLEGKIPEALKNDRLTTIKFLSEDCNDILEHGNGFVFTEPLWPIRLRMPQPFSYSMKKFDETVRLMPEKWSFWRYWYQGFLDGTPLDWELQREISFIPDEDWNQGPAHIAKIIEGIRAKYDVRSAIADLTADRTQSIVNRHGIGGNAPPEVIDDATALVSHATIIWAGVEGWNERSMRPSQVKNVCKQPFSFWFRVSHP